MKKREEFYKGAKEAITEVLEHLEKFDEKNEKNRVWNKNFYSLPKNPMNFSCVEGFVKKGRTIISFVSYSGVGTREIELAFTKNALNKLDRKEIFNTIPYFYKKTLALEKAYKFDLLPLKEKDRILE